MLFFIAIISTKAGIERLVLSPMVDRAGRFISHLGGVGTSHDQFFHYIITFARTA